MGSWIEERAKLYDAKTVPFKQCYAKKIEKSPSKKTAIKTEKEKILEPAKRIAEACRYPLMIIKSNHVQKSDENAFEKIPKKLAGRKYESYRAEMHAHLINVSLHDAIKAAGRKNLDIVAFLEYNSDNFSRYVDEAKDKRFALDPEFFEDHIVFFKRSSRPMIMLRGIEYMTSENIHINLLGKIEGLEPKKSIFYALEKAIEKEWIITLDHPGVDASCPYMPLEKKTSDFLEEICERYGKNMAIEFNAYCIPKVWDELRDLFKKMSKVCNWRNIRERVLDKNPNDYAKELSEKYSMPICASTDLHARTKGLLQDIGTAYMDFNIEMNGSPIKSIKNGMFNGAKKHEGYVNVGHMLRAFGMPVILSRFKNVYKLRG